MTGDALAQLSDKDLLVEVRDLVQRERHTTAQLVAALTELDARQLYLGEGCSSLFTYCTQILHLSEHAAYGRIEAARAARRFPVILDLLTDGSLTLTSVGVLAPHLTPDNHYDVLAAARHKSKRDVEHLVARLAPRPAVPATVRKLPDPKPTELSRPQPAVEAPAGDPVPLPPAGMPQPPKRSAVVVPLAPERYKVQFTASRETYNKLRRAQHLLRHTIPDGDPAAIFDRALTVLLAQLEKTKVAATARPRPPRGDGRVSPHPRGGAAGGLDARPRAMCVRRDQGSLLGTGLPGVSPCPAVCCRWRGRR